MSYYYQWLVVVGKDLLFRSSSNTQVVVGVEEDPFYEAISKGGVICLALRS